jgi:hypothetical protein
VLEQDSDEFGMVSVQMPRTTKMAVIAKPVPAISLAVAFMATSKGMR